MTNGTIIISVIAALSAIIAAGIPIWLTRKRYPTQDVTNATTIVGAAEGVVGLLHAELSRIEADRKSDREEVEKLRDEVTAMRIELGAEERRTANLVSKVNKMQAILEEYRKGITVLIEQLFSLGHTPAWQPREEEPT